jgi:transcriptional regulator with XRE-family HTH domain
MCEFPALGQVLPQVSQVLRDLRRARGYTPQLVVDLLNALGVSISVRALYSYERNRRPVTITRLCELCAVYQVSPPEVLAEAIQRADREPPS